MTPIQTTTLEGKTFEAVDEEVGRSLSASNNALVWAGSAIDDWAAGVNTYKTSDGGSISVTDGADAVWIKHTGFDYADGTTVNTATVILTVNTKVIGRLEAGEGMILPHPGTITITLSDDGTPAQVEYGVFT